MRITWIVIGTSLLVLGGFAGYAVAPLFNTVEVHDEEPDNIVNVQDDDAPAPEEQMPNSISLRHLSKDETRAMMRDLINANRTDSAPMDEPMVSATSAEQASAGAHETHAPTEDDNTSSSSLTSFDPQRTYPVVDTPLHPAEGHVRVLATSEGTVLRYENFSTINGPNLHLYLAKDLDAREFIDIGPIKGTKGNINYLVPENVDLSEYRYVLYWCVPFRVLFNYVDLAS